MEAPINRLPAAQQQQQQHSSGGMAASGVISMDISSSTVHSRSHTASCSVLERFAALLGSKGRPQQDIGASSSRIKELTSLLSSTVDDDDVVLTVPSLDLRLTESGEKGPNELLPEVGAHAASATGTGASASDMKDGFSNGDSTAAGFASSSSSSSLNSSRPHMAASVLSMAPSLTSSSSSESTVADDQAVIDKAAQNIGKRTSWTRSTVGYASGAVGVNISDSFTTLLNSRLRAWTLLLLRHSLSTGSGESRTRLLSMLAADIQVKSIETDFKTLPLPDAAKGAKPKDSDIILPLLFQVTLHTTIQNQPENVTLRAPGTISAIFDSGTGLKKINVQLDTRVVLKSMLDQARIAVMKAVASATDTTVPAISELSRNVSTVGVNKPVGVGSAVGAASNAAFPLRREPSLSTIPEAAKRGSSFGLAQSSSSTSSTDPDEANRLKKARTSALRLNSVLHGRSLGGRSASGASSSINLSTHRNNTPHSGVGNSNTSGSTIPQVRSVRFDHLIRAPKLTSELTPTPNPEKLRMAQTVSKLKSYKSFGRPHAGDFGTGPRNATFGEFGFAGAWGRDGRLAAHPMPGQSNPFDAMLESGGGGSSSIASGGVDRNATFNLSRNSGSMMSMSSSNPFLRPNGPTAAGAAPGFSTPAAASGAALLNRVNSSAHTASPSMPRTATALESMFVKKWT